MAVMNFWRSGFGSTAAAAAFDVEDEGGVAFWTFPERAGWLMKQGEYIKTWRRRWFVPKQGKLFWLKESLVTSASVPRGVIPIAACRAVKGAEDALNRVFALTPRGRRKSGSTRSAAQLSYTSGSILNLRFSTTTEAKRLCSR